MNMMLGYLTAEGARRLELSLLFDFAVWCASLVFCVIVIRRCAPPQQRLGACIAAIVLWIVLPYAALVLRLL